MPMKFFLCFVALLIQCLAWCQDNALGIYPMPIIGQFPEAEIVSLTKTDSLNQSDYFFTETFNEAHGLFLVKKEKEYWVVYDFELYLNAGHNSTISGIRKINDRFVSIQVYSFPSGICESRYGKIILMDVIRNEYIEFFNFAETICFDENGKPNSRSTCQAKYSFKKNILKIKSTKKPGDTQDCIESGKFRYCNGQFVRMK
jgi:hypothetical protein